MELRCLFFCVTTLIFLSHALCVSLPPTATLLRSNKLASHLRNKRSVLPNKRTHKKQTPKPVPSKPKTRLCNWDAASKSCQMNEGAAADYLVRYGNALSSFIGNFATCDAVKDAASCTSTSNCIWDAAEERCYFVHIVQGQEDSKCHAAAPDFINLKYYSPFCPTITSSKRCNKHRYCSWDHDYQACAPDVYQVLYGFSEQSYDKVASTVLPHWINEWLELFLEEFDLNDPKFKWRQVLDWDVPEGTCPKDADAKVCAFIHESTVPLLPNQYYCGLKYSKAESESKCNADSICKYDDRVHGCIVSASDAKVASIGFKATLQFIETPLDKQIIAAFAECYKITKKKKCKGHCSWDASDGTCISKQEWVHRKVAQVDNEGTDVLCTYLSILADSGCLDLYSPDMCSANPTCAWRQLDGVCLPTAQNLMDAVLQQDPEASAALDDFEGKCAKKKTKKKCQGKKNVSQLRSA